MTSFKEASTNKTIFLLRKVFYNTPIMRWRLTAYIYDKVFTYGMPDLSKPISFRSAQFYVDPKDRSYLPSMVGGYYEKHELDLFIGTAKESEILLDIGANLGMYSVLAAKTTDKISCYAFEPVTENQELLQKNIVLNKLKGRIKLVKSAVSEKDGTALIHLSEKLTGTHSLSVDRGGGTRKIKTVSVDSYCRKHNLSPDLIKIDVEGHEASVFKGMQEVVQSKPTIFMEYVPELNKDMGLLMKDLAKLYKDCFVVDTVHGTVEKILINDIDQSKRYNIILSKNKKHLKSINSLIKQGA